MNALAKLAETRHGHISMLENGKIPRPSVELLSKIAVALKVPIEDLVGGPDYNPASQLAPPAPDRITELAQLTQVHDSARVEKLLRMAEQMTDEEYDRLLDLVERFAHIRQQERQLLEELEQGRVSRPAEPEDENGGMSEVG
jgi:transcriptional regulator with XRE-family HTH domain